MKRTPLQQERLDAAVAALQAAGAEKLPGRLMSALREPGPDMWSEAHAVLAQARSWASTRPSGPEHQRARDAIGALWAVMEDEVTQ